MPAREPVTLAPEELARLRQVVMPHIESIRELKHDLESAQATFDNILTGFLVGKGLEGTWNINFDSGLIRPLPIFSDNGSEDPAIASQPSASEGEPNV